jgi:hypothetical protein
MDFSGEQMKYDIAIESYTIPSITQGIRVHGAGVSTKSAGADTLSKELNMFLFLRTTVLCTVVYRNIMKLSFIASVVAFCNTTFFLSVYCYRFNIN